MRTHAHASCTNAHTHAHPPTHPHTPTHTRARAHTHPALPRAVVCGGCAVPSTSASRACWCHRGDSFSLQRDGPERPADAQGPHCLPPISVVASCTHAAHCTLHQWTRCDVYAQWTLHVAPSSLYVVGATAARWRVVVFGTALSRGLPLWAFAHSLHQKVMERYTTTLPFWLLYKLFPS
jgi:hypothetical protein